MPTYAYVWYTFHTRQRIRYFQLKPTKTSHWQYHNSYFIFAFATNDLWVPRKDTFQNAVWNALLLEWISRSFCFPTIRHAANVYTDFKRLQTLWQHMESCWSHGRLQAAYTMTWKTSHRICQKSLQTSWKSNGRLLLNIRTDPSDNYVRSHII